MFVLCLCCGVWQKKIRDSLSLSAFGHCWEGMREHLCRFEGQRSSLFILPAQLERRVCKPSTPAGRLKHTWVDVRIHTFMPEHSDSQTNLCLRCTHARTAHTGGEVDAGGAHQQAITQHVHPPAHTQLFQSPDLILTLTSTGNLSTCFYYQRWCLEEGAAVRSTVKSVLILLPATQHDRSRNHCQVGCSVMQTEGC